MNSYYTMTDDLFAPGAICLIKSLRRFTNLPVGVIDLGLNNENKRLIENCGAVIYSPDKITSKQARTKPWHRSAEFANLCFNKLHLWNSDFDRVIYLDADMLAVKPIDHLFSLNVPFAACPAYVQNYNAKTKELISGGWSKEWFNAGFLLIKPDKKIFNELLALKDVVFCERDPSDQGFLNEYYRNKWHKLEPIYNATRRLFVADKERWSSIERDISVIHFTLEKPWLEAAKGCEKIEKIWWDCYDPELLRRNRS